MTDDRDLLASAYLDNEVTQEERALVEADAELYGEVEALQTIRAQLHDVEPQRISVREDQLAAALSAWDRLPVAERLGTGADTTPAGGSRTMATAAALSTHRRRRVSPRWLAAAAAGLVVIVGAAVVLQQVDGRNDEAADLSSDAAPAEADGGDEVDAADTDTATEVTEAGGATEADSAELPAATGASAEELVADDLQDEATALEELEAAGVDTENATPSAGVSDLGPPADGDITELPVLTDAQDLQDFAAFAAEAPLETQPPAEAAPAEVEAAPAEVEADASTSTVLPSCDHLGIDVSVGPAVYGDLGVVMVGIDADRNVAIAYLPTTCAPALTVDLP